MIISLDDIKSKYMKKLIFMNLKMMIKITRKINPKQGVKTLNLVENRLIILLKKEKEIKKAMKIKSRKLKSE